LSLDTLSSRCLRVACSPSSAARSCSSRPSASSRARRSRSSAAQASASGPFLTELLLHRGERGSLVRQGRLQPLGLLEGRVVPLELGAGGDDLGLLRRRDVARSRQVLASPTQRVVALH
jgi:hypothetical protein